MRKRAFVDGFEVFADCFSFDNGPSFFIDKFPVELPVKPISSLHYHNMTEIGICIRGSGLFYSNLQSECINKDDIMFFLPGVAHFSQSLSASELCACRFAFIDTASLLFLLFKENETEVRLISEAQSYNIPSIIRKSEHPYAHRILSSLLSDAFEQNDNADFFIALHLAEFFMKLPLLFEKNDMIARKDNNDSGEDIICAVEAFISAHYNESLNIQRLCSICNLSASQLRRKYKERFGVSPMAYMHILRCNIGAQLLLHTAMSVNAITQKIGYFDSSEFYKHFQNVFHCSPSNYRRGGKADEK